MKRPDTKPVPVSALIPWYYSEVGATIRGGVIGTIDTDMGRHYVLEDEDGNRYRLPLHVDLKRKIEAVLLSESMPWLEIKCDGFQEDGRSRLYAVNHYPRR